MEGVWRSRNGGDQPAMRIESRIKSAADSLLRANFSA
jgi:hypothetical protein